MNIQQKEGKTVAVFSQSDGTIVPDDGGYVLIDKDIKPNPDDKVYHPGTPIFAPSYKILATHGIPKLEGVPELVKVNPFDRAIDTIRKILVWADTPAEDHKQYYHFLIDAKQKYKYTDADMERAISMARKLTMSTNLVPHNKYITQEILQIIQIPERLELEVEKYVLGDTPKLKSDNEKIFLNC